MSLTKQAKILSEKQQTAVLRYLAANRHPQRNILIFLLSVDAGLRSKEIAALEWDMITDAAGVLSDSIHLPNTASKGSSGGVIYLSRRLERAFKDYFSEVPNRFGPVITSQKGGKMSGQVITNWFYGLYQDLGFQGCSSHSGRRTAITRWARKISSVGGSMRDVQYLARHSSLAMTQRYVEVAEDACRRVVG